MIDPLSLVGKIPFALNTINSLSSLFQQPYQPPRTYQENSKEVFKQGGKIRGHNKYNAPTHEQGGQLVNDQGIPSPMGTNEIEKKESKYTYSNIKQDTYVFTPEDTKKVNKITKKYNKANSSELDKNALELEVQRVENKNEQMKAKKKYKQGGKIYRDGGPLSTLNLNPLLRGYSTMRDAPIQQLTSTPLATINTPAAPNTLPGTPKLVSAKRQDQTSSNPLGDLDKMRQGLLAIDSLNLLRKPERENPIMTNYGAARKELNKLEANLDPLKEQVAQSSNQLRSVNRNSASSYNTFANREAQRVANLQQSLSGINLQERNLSNSIAAQKAQFESNVAVDNKRTLEQNRINNQQNAANTRTIGSQIGTDIMAEVDRKSTAINQANIAQASRAEGMSLMSSMFSNFQPGDYDVVYQVATKGYDSLSPAMKKRFDNLQTVKYKE